MRPRRRSLVCKEQSDNLGGRKSSIRNGMDGILTRVLVEIALVTVGAVKWNMVFCVIFPLRPKMT